MKRLYVLLLGLAFIMPVCGFASDSDLAPTENVTVSDINHNFVVVSSDIVNDLITDFDNTSAGHESELDLFAGKNSNTNQFGLPSMYIRMDKVFTEYPYIDEWKTNKRNLGLKLTYNKNDGDSENRIRYLMY